MTIDPPPIQEPSAESTGLFPQTWIRWFDAVTSQVNAKDDLVQPTTTITASKTIGLLSRNVFVDATSGALTVTLPSASSAVGRYFNVKKIDSTSNAVTVDADGSETIDGSTTASLASQYDSLSIVSDGTEWFII